MVLKWSYCNQQTPCYSSSLMNRQLIGCLGDVQSPADQAGGDRGPLPPQDALRGWLDRAHSLAMQCTVALDQLYLLLQCCPETTPQGEGPSVRHSAPLSYSSPLDAESCPPGCRMRRGDPVWARAMQTVTGMLTDTKALKAELGELVQQCIVGKLQTW